MKALSPYVSSFYIGFFGIFICGFIVTVTG
jgi:hypothetical protein